MQRERWAFGRAGGLGMPNAPYYVEYRIFFELLVYFNHRKMTFKFKKKGLRREIPKDLILRAIEEVSKGSKI